MSQETWLGISLSLSLSLSLGIQATEKAQEVHCSQCLRMRKTQFLYREICSLGIYGQVIMNEDINNKTLT